MTSPPPPPPLYASIRYILKNSYGSFNTWETTRVFVSRAYKATIDISCWYAYIHTFPYEENRFTHMANRGVSATVTASKSASHHHQPPAHYTSSQTTRLNQYAHPSLMLHVMVLVVVDLSTALALVIWHMQRQLKFHLKKIALATFLFI